MFDSGVPFDLGRNLVLIIPFKGRSVTYGVLSRGTQPHRRVRLLPPLPQTQALAALRCPRRSPSAHPARAQTILLRLLSLTSPDTAGPREGRGLGGLGWAHGAKGRKSVNCSISSLSRKRTCAESGQMFSVKRCRCNLWSWMDDGLQDTRQARPDQSRMAR